MSNDSFNHEYNLVRNNDVDEEILADTNTDIYLDEVKSAVNQRQTTNAQVISFFLSQPKLLEIMHNSDNKVSTQSISTEMRETIRRSIPSSNSATYATYLRLATSLRFQVAPAKPSAAIQLARFINTLLTKTTVNFSDSTTIKLRQLQNYSTNVAEDPLQQNIEQRQQDSRLWGDSKAPLIVKQNGIERLYAYAFPKYVDTDGETFFGTFKIGSTKNEVNTRISQQKVHSPLSSVDDDFNRAHTGMPEDWRVYREYRAKEGYDVNVRECERNIHRILKAAGMWRVPGLYSGHEWFDVNLDLLDTICDVLGLEPYFVYGQDE